MTMLRWIEGISWKDHIRSEESRKKAKVKPIVAHVTKTATQLVWTRMTKRTGARHGYNWKKTQRQAPYQMDGQYTVWRYMKTYGLDDQMMEDRNVWSKMVATVDTC